MTNATKLFEKDKFTIGDFIDTVLRIKDKDEARQFYEAYVPWLEAHCAEHRYTPEQIAKANIGWCFGEGMEDEYVRMWHEVCGAAHPIFGITQPTAEEAVEAGRKFATNRLP